MLACIFTSQLLLAYDLRTFNKKTWSFNTSTSQGCVALTRQWRDLHEEDDASVHTRTRTHAHEDARTRTIRQTKTHTHALMSDRSNVLWGIAKKEASSGGWSLNPDIQKLRDSDPM